MSDVSFNLNVVCSGSKLIFYSSPRPFGFQETMFNRLEEINLLLFTTLTLEYLSISLEKIYTFGNYGKQCK